MNVCISIAEHELEIVHRGRGQGWRKGTVVPESPESLRNRFNEKWTPEPNSGCWMWTKTVCNSGYGEFSIKHVNHYAHRVSYEIFKGPVPEGLQVLHHCDTPLCVNPDHLFTGTNQDNRTDSKNKGRTPKGERNGSSKLDDHKVSEIRRLYSCGNISHRELGRIFGVTKTMIGYIVRNCNWKHVT